ncbi:hypothetical protein K443DRAFT_320663 [Laccaria amethystina LaAM-08-1]|uniref:Unplaced genomic scaffold K443scaffold_210, whole genome shotgun sequence n=1 Tax=Laccaria amethystina LaAM-08-1 TaxID=1095629 RepID=A0A0C9XDC7_9AGAR|nr:hypothetical protein K443DRAFT_320663 [Laccaria amethystina LaAM-08-1]
MRVLTGYEEHYIPTSWYPCHQRNRSLFHTLNVTNLPHPPSPPEGLSSLGDATTTDEALAKSMVDQLPSLQCVTIVRFVIDLSELDGGRGSERPRERRK